MLTLPPLIRAACVQYFGYLNFDEHSTVLVVAPIQPWSKWLGNVVILSEDSKVQVYRPSNIIKAEDLPLFSKKR